jgi:uncharacterized membrane-anchored protein YjiN (DUF445 family)
MIQTTRMAAPERNHVGTVSLVISVAGAVACHVGLTTGPFVDALWLRVLAAGFEAAVVGGLADWFAVTALFRHPLGIPIPHTAIIPHRRAKLTEGIVNMVEQDWLSPEVIGARLMRFAPSRIVVEWLSDPEHVERLSAPIRDLMRGFARTLTEPEVARFVEETMEGQLKSVPLDAATGRWLAHAIQSEAGNAAFTSAATSLANLARRPRTAAELHWWIDRSARTLRAGGKRFVPFMLRRKIVQRKIVEAACDYAASELGNAARNLDHPLRRLFRRSLGGFAERLAAGDADALAQAERLRAAVLESLESGELVKTMLGRLRAQLEGELADPSGRLSRLVDRKLRELVLDRLDDPERQAAFDRWVRTTADQLLRKYHHQIGITVRENLEALDTGALVERIESRVGADLQFIRLNGAVVGGLVGMALAVVHWLLH